MSRQSSRKERIIQKKVDGCYDFEPLDLYNLLVVGGITINRKQMEDCSNQSKKIIKNNRKASHKSLGINQQMVKQKFRFKVSSSRHPTESVNPKAKKLMRQIEHNEDLLNQQEKQNLETSPPTDRTKYHKQPKRIAKQQLKQNEEKQSAKTVQVQNNFVEKKMKIGHKSKSDAMKKFIIETLLKGKAQGNSLTIHKGTAQCVNSPKRQYNKSEVTHDSKEKYSLVLIQNKSKSVVPKRKAFLPPLPNQPRMQKAQSKNTSNIPSLPKNKKWVAMVKKIQKKQSSSQQLKQQKQAQEMIQQNIVQQNVSEVHLPIPQQIQQ